MVVHVPRLLSFLKAELHPALHCGMDCESTNSSDPPRHIFRAPLSKMLPTMKETWGLLGTPDTQEADIDIGLSLAGARCIIIRKAILPLLTISTPL